MTAALPWAKVNESWKREIDKYLLQLHEEPIKKLMKECLSHRLADVYVKEVKAYLQEDAADWNFLQEEGYAEYEDLYAFLVWIVDREIKEYKAKVKNVGNAASLNAAETRKRRHPEDESKEQG